MTLRELLRDNKSGIVKRWQEYALSSYAADASGFMKSEKDRFANPVGHSLIAGTEAIFDNLLDDMNAESVCSHLDAMIKVRAIQELTPSQAVSFVFSLKQAIRHEIGDRIEGPRLIAELGDTDAKIDQIALFAFDIYARCRDKVCELRINEVKRSVAAVMQRLGVDVEEPEPAGQTPGNGSSTRGGSQ